MCIQCRFDFQNLAINFVVIMVTMVTVEDSHLASISLSLKRIDTTPFGFSESGLTSPPVMTFLYLW